MWYNIISAVCAILALLISVAGLRHRKDTQKSEEIKDDFKEIEKDIESIKNTLKDLSVLEERINNEIRVSEKYRDRVSEKLEDIIRMIYEK